MTIEGLVKTVLSYWRGKILKSRKQNSSESRKHKTRRIIEVIPSDTMSLSIEKATKNELSIKNYASKLRLLVHHYHQYINRLCCFIFSSKKLKNCRSNSLIHSFCAVILNFIRRKSIQVAKIFIYWLSVSMQQCLGHANTNLLKQIASVNLETDSEMSWDTMNTCTRNAVEILISHRPRFMVHPSHRILLAIVIHRALRTR